MAAKVWSVQDVLDADSGEVIGCFHGTIVKVESAESGKDEEGEWSRQLIELKDPEGDVIPCLLKNRIPKFSEVSPKMNGTSLVLLATQDGDDKIGLYAKDVKGERMLVADLDAEITKAGAAKSGDKDGEGEPQDEHEPEEPQGRSKESDAIDIACQEYTKLGNGYLLAYQLMVEVGQLCEQETGTKMTDAHFASAVHTILIEANKRGINDNLPTTPIVALKPKNAPVAQAEPDKAETLPDERGGGKAEGTEPAKSKGAKKPKSRK